MSWRFSAACGPRGRRTTGLRRPRGDEHIDDSELAGQIHEPCQYPTECAAGLACVETVFAAVECDPDQIACCEPYCELGVDICPGVGQECTQIYIFEDVGVCVLP